MSDLEVLVAQYSILTNLASFISTLDLFHLALTNKAINSYILPSQQFFDILKRGCICDGHGLRDRKAFTGLYKFRGHYHWGNERRVRADEPIEVRVYGTKCDASDTLPCRKCTVNVCEECRYYPREAPKRSYPVRRPHLNSPWQNENLMCLCESCDDKLEAELKGQFLNELCDCDVFRRWLCNKCRREELQFTSDYYDNHTRGDWEMDDDEDELPATKVMSDHQHNRRFLCSCGAAVPEHTRPRCTWCKRRHLPEDKWYQEWQEIGRHMPMFDEDPCYPPFIGDIYATHCSEFYPKLKYSGPIWEVPEQSAEQAVLSSDIAASTEANS